MIRVSKDRQERLKEWLDTTTKGIVRSEIQTIKETSIEDHCIRIYIFTNFSMGLATVNSQEANLSKAIQQTITLFKKEEYKGMDEGQQEQYEEYGSNVVGLFAVIPSKVVKLVKANPEHMELIERFENHDISVEEFQQHPLYIENCKLMITTTYATPFTEIVNHYDLIIHNGEVLDVKLDMSMNVESKDIVRGLQLRDYLEVELE